MVGEISDSRIRPLGGMLACPCHVAVTAGEAKGGWVGRSCRAADSGDGKRGGEEPDVVQRSCDSQHVDSPTLT